MAFKSVLPEKRRTIYAHLNDPKLVQGNGRITLFPEPKSDCEDELTGIVCNACGVELRVRKKDTQDCDCYWCSQECYKASPWEFPKFKEYVRPGTAQTEEKVCPKCGGPARGRGFVHTEDCEDVVKKNEKRSCPECGGPAKGRGFKHSDECSLKTQPYVPVKERNGDDQEEDQEDSIEE